MFQLRHEHLAALETANREEFHFRMLRRFRTTMPTFTEKQSDEHLLAVLTKADDSARQSGLRTYRDISDWCLLSLIAGVDFYANPVIAGLLSRNPAQAGSVLRQLVAGFSQIATQRDHAEASSMEAAKSCRPE